MVSRLPRLALCGPGRSGKDEAAKWLTQNTMMRFGKSTSEVIAPYRAAELGVSVEEAFANRHQERVVWYELGNRLRERDAAFLARECLKGGELVVGIRDREELLAVKKEGLVDLCIWLDRFVEPDPTMKYGPELCDLIITNYTTLEDFHDKLKALAKAAGWYLNSLPGGCK